MINFVGAILLFAFLWWRSEKAEKDAQRRILRLLEFAERPLSTKDFHHFADLGIAVSVIHADRLEKEGFLQSELVQGPRDVKPRRYYLLTAKGIERAMDILQ